MTIVVATRNLGKLREMSHLCKQNLPGVDDLQLVGLKAFPTMPPIEETGSSFHENAQLKALAVANHTGLMAIGDDSGLEVDALGGAPGIFSARYAGPAARDEENNRKLMDALRDVPQDQRTARFRCVIAVALPGTVLGLFDGACHGIIGFEPRGGSGFGYDPLFIKTDYGMTFAELPTAVKNRISHRAHAIEKAAIIIQRYVDRAEDTSRKRR